MSEIDIAVLRQQAENLYSNVNEIGMMSQPVLKDKDYSSYGANSKDHLNDIEKLKEKIFDILKYLDNDAVPIKEGE